MVNENNSPTSLHIFTIGVSVLRNIERRHPREIRHHAENLNIDVNALTTGALSKGLPNTVEELRKLSRENPKLREFLSFLTQKLRGDPRGLSAELNAFLSFVPSAEKGNSSVELILLYTQTPAGALSAHTVGSLLEEWGYPVDYVGLEGYGGPDEFDRGLVQLVRAFTQVMESAQERARREGRRMHMFINATGGFKPEAAFMTILGFLSPLVQGVYYIHENYRQAVMLPTLRITWDQEWICGLLDLDGTDEKTARELLLHTDLPLDDLESLLTQGLLSRRPDGTLEVAPWVRMLTELYPPHAPCPKR